ncbi:MAG: AsmA-like C-terminal region-containing protein [Methylacidiphilales bacterium]|nr:AsmA-like C-terminal region-containing protein [Candidatus Methylacidiphilales bacterium]
MLKKIIIVLGILTLLAIFLIGAGAFFGSRYLNSPEFKQVVSAQVNQATGLRVSLDSVQIGLFGIGVNNLQIPNPEPYAKENFISIGGVHADIDWLSAFKDPLTIRKIRIDKPVLILHQRQAGGFYLPLPEKAPAATAPSDSGKPSPSETAKTSNISLPDISITGAQVTIFAADGSVLFKAENAGLQASYEKRGQEQTARGNLDVKQATVTPGFKVSDFRTPVVFEANKLRLSKVVASAYQGALAGEAGLDLSLGFFDVKLNLAGVSVSDLLVDLGNPPDTMKGKLLLDFQGKGFLSAAKDLTGNGNLKITEPEIGKLKSYHELASVLGAIAGVSALREGKFQEIHSTFNISDQKIDLQPLDVISPNLSIFMKGPYGFDKSLNLEGTVDFAPGLLQVTEVASALTGLFGAKKSDNTQPADASSRANIKMPITVTGTTDDPKVTLTKAAGDQTQPNLQPQNTPDNKPADTEKKPGVEGFLKNLLP